jgi:phosphatidylglycerol---prolipoprotein diacylglyceryl transferase
MRRVLFHFAGTPIYSYPAMLYLGIVLGIYAELYAALTSGLNVASTLAATLVLLTTALLGARLLHVVAEWPAYRDRPREILQFAKGGAAMYGGLLIAVPLSVPVLAVLKLPIGAFWDVASFTMLTGMIVTRVGCFLNGCCAGRPTRSRWGMNLPNHHGVWRRRIPAQIVEAAWGLVVLAGAMVVWRHLSFQGALFFYAIGTYGLGRVLLESIRDEQDRVMGVTLHKAISIGLVVIAISVFATAWSR